jgi:hypothetical protein
VVEREALWGEQDAGIEAPRRGSDQCLYRDKEMLEFASVIS